MLASQKTGVQLRDKQLPPDGDWTVWLLMAGRGFGKTLTGAKYIDGLARKDGAYRLALVGRTAGDVRDVMVEGSTGVLGLNPSVKYEPSKRRLTWPNGAVATTFTADKPDMLRGPQHHFAWCDELAAWNYAKETWDNLMLGLRLGQHPKVLVTTTPRPIKIIRELVDRHGKDVSVVRGTTYENLENLAPTFQAEILRRYEGTRLGRQELEAELLTEIPGALWKRDLLDEQRGEAKAYKRVAIAVDPAVTAAEGSDETGIVVCAKGEDDHGYVLEDLSGRYTPDEWARVVANAYAVHEANIVIAEVNNGGDLVEKNIKSVNASLPVTQVRAAKGKYTRAEPVAALYEQKRIYHAKSFPDLEDQMCTWVPGDKSPDRVDALVWGMTELMVQGMPAMVFD